MAKGREAEILKHDPFLQQYEKVSGKVKKNSRNLINTLIGVGVVTALILIAWLIYSRRVNNAGEALAEAYRVNDATVANPIPPDVKGYVFTTQDEKHRKAYEAFTKAANDYPSYNGELGRYYAAAHQLSFEPEKAEAALKELAAQNSSIGLQAQMALAGRYETAGKFEDAIATYQKLIGNPGELSVFLLKLKLARSFEGAKKTKEATDLYFELASNEELRTTPLGTEAVSRLTVLDPSRVEKLPEVKSQPGLGGVTNPPIKVG